MLTALISKSLATSWSVRPRNPEWLDKNPAAAGFFYEMTFYAVAFDEITLDEMTFDEMTFDEIGQ